MSSLARLQPQGLITQDKALALVLACEKQLKEATTIPQVVSAITHADAVIAVTAKLKAADRIRRLALRIRVDAEIALGKLSDSIPPGKRGPQGPDSPPSKTKVLNDMGVHRARAAMATRLANLPPAKVAKIVETIPIRSGISGVLQEAGIAKRWADPTKLNGDLAFLAGEAVGLLERCATQGMVPHAGTVAELRRRLERMASYRKT